MDGPEDRVRRRYVGFRVSVEDGSVPDRKAMVEAMDGASRAMGLPDRRRLTVFTGHLGIAKCEHRELGAMVQALTSIDDVGGSPARVETLVSSGTIKKVKAHLGLDRRA
jgi:RNase P/RNase MRP subunit POP5